MLTLDNPKNLISEQKKLVAYLQFSKLLQDMKWFLTNKIKVTKQ